MARTIEILVVQEQPGALFFYLIIRTKGVLIQLETFKVLETLKVLPSVRNLQGFGNLEGFALS